MDLPLLILFPSGDNRRGRDSHAKHSEFHSTDEGQGARDRERLCPSDMSVPWYRVISQEQIPSVFPEAFRAKMDHAVIMGSGDASGKVFLVCNCHRVDRKALAIDQEPFAVVFDSDMPSESGVFIHHGDWQGRTESEVPPEFWSHVDASGIGDYYPPPSLPPNSSGSLHDLASSSNLNAFSQSLKTMLRFGDLHLQQPAHGEGRQDEAGEFPHE